MKRNIVVTFLVFSLCMCFTGCFTSIRSSKTDYVKRRSESSVSQNVLPDLNNLPPYKKLNYQYRWILRIIFVSETMRLVVTYDEETYQKEKTNINNLKFLKNPVPWESHFDNDEKLYLLPEHEFNINSYNFRVLEADEDNGFNYPKRIGIIATSDMKKSIAYLYSDDFDLDYIGENNAKNAMVKFVKENFKYRW
ncbi:hypothetical protein FACS1894110_15760 [Spirochaetia bacterium]|nr:hypothetical protein FACS1894110_15760 [Spirochaetia bacterium]